MSISYKNDEKLEELRSFYHGVIDNGKKVLIVGKIGTGKTELINKMMRYSKGVTTYYDYLFWIRRGRTTRIEFDINDYNNTIILDLDIDFNKYEEEIKKYPGAIIVSAHKKEKVYLFDYVIEMKENYDYEIKEVTRA